MLRSGARHPDADSQAASTSQTPQEGPAMDWSQFYATLNEYLQLEPKFQPRLCLPTHSENGEVTVGARDGAAHLLRSLKVWFDLPTEVFIDAISLFDRFLTKMKVRPCHVPCITVSCLYISIQQHAEDNGYTSRVPIDELVKISSSGCTASDVARMSRVITQKLSLVNNSRLTLLHWLKLFTVPTSHLPVCEESELLKLLEVAVCDAGCVNARMSELALVLLFYKLEQDLVELSKRVGGNPIPEEVYYLYDFGAQLQAVCHMSDSGLIATRQRHASVMSRYEARSAATHRQRLTWRLSERTLKVLRPTDRLTSLLPTIEEQHYADATPTSPVRNRSSGSESSEEETSDWPRSPVLPIYCDN